MKKKKRKLRFKRIITFLLLFCIISSFLFVLLNYPIKNIYVKGNVYLSDQEIIDLAGLRKYPSFLQTTKSKTEKTIKKNILIKTAKIEKRKFGKIVINITEYKPLFYDINTKKNIISNGNSIDSKFDVPILISLVPKEVYDKLIFALDKLEEDVMLKISEIEYVRTEQDEERFLLKMTDKNKIFVNIRKFEDINFYNELLSTIEGKTGTWHLDYGNFFVSDWYFYPFHSIMYII